MNVVKTLTLPISMLLIVLAVFGCTKQAWYEGAKQGAENECRHQAPSEIDKCLANLNKKTYQDYENARSNAK